jgi:arylamine N-acetyltransferase
MSTTDTRTRLPQNLPLAVRPLTAEVRSETDPNKAYTVTLPQCRAADGSPCPDFFYRRGNPTSPFCKHLKAAMGIPDTSRLDFEAAMDLLVTFGAGRTAVLNALRRAGNSPQGTVTTPGGTIVVILSNGDQSFDVRLP